MKLHFIRFLLEPHSDDLIAQKIGGTIARVYTLAHDNDEAVSIARHAIGKIHSKWKIDLLEQITKVTPKSYDDMEQDLDSILKAIEDKEVVVDLECWLTQG